MSHTACDNNPKELWLVGISTGHSVAPVLHTFIAKELGLPWTYRSKEFVDERDCVQQIRSGVCAGCAVTMPWKATIMPLLDEIDVSAQMIAACNTVSIDAKGRLTAYNHDCVGIAGALRELAMDETNTTTDRRGLVIGAGGAGRAAVYALWRDLGVKYIYIINRDEQEVLDLQKDVNRGLALSGQSIRLQHIRTSEDAAALISPTYVVGTVPDFEPITPDELAVKSLLAQILNQGTEKGILVDMCYKPRYTRHIAIAEKAGWKTVQGWRVVGHQAKQQWTTWAGDEFKERLDEIEGKFWKALKDESEANPIINADLTSPLRTRNRL